MARRCTTEEFIQKAVSLYGTKYDYSEVNYINAYTKVIVTCDKGHRYFQMPNSHLKGSVCRECIGRGTKTTDKEIRRNEVKKIIDEYNKKVGKSSVRTTDEFKAKARAIHGEGSFNYDEVDYKSTKEPVWITCKNGHRFSQSPRHHINGNGCKECSGKKQYTNETFKQKSIEVHGDVFDYSEVDYKNAYTKVKLTCKKCNTSFLQFPTSNICGKGCKVCSMKEVGLKSRNTPSKFKFDGKPTILYYVKFEEESIYKIGITTRSTRLRFKSDNKPYKIIKEWLFEDGADALKVEQEYHDQFKEFRYITTDFLNGGNNELYIKDVLSLDK